MTLWGKNMAMSVRTYFQSSVLYTMTLTAIEYNKEQHVLSLLDQRCLPTRTIYIDCTTSKEVIDYVIPLFDYIGTVIPFKSRGDV